MNIFITGISSGIGRSLATKLVKQKHSVWGVARNQEALTLLETEVNSKNLFVAKCDLESIKDMKQVVEQMKNKNFLPDIVILNAAVNILNTESFDLGDYRKAFDINLYGAMFWVEQFIDEFLKRDNGQFIAISSTSAFRKGFGGVSYSASKAALSITFRRLRTQFIETGLKFSTVYFGPINTKSWDGPKFRLFVPTEDKASKFIIKLLGKANGEYFFPLLTTLLARLSLLFPDSFLYFCTKYFMKIFTKSNNSS